MQPSYRAHRPDDQALRGERPDHTDIAARRVQGPRIPRDPDPWAGQRGAVERTSPLLIGGCRAVDPSRTHLAAGGGHSGDATAVSRTGLRWYFVLPD